MEFRKLLQKGYVKFYQIFTKKEENPPPIIYFFMFFYFHFFRHTHAPSTTYLLSIFPFTVFLSLNFNFMFMTAEFVRLPNLIPASIIFLITLTVSCNDKWKAFIFLFTVGDILAKDPNFHSVYLVFASGLLSYQIYNSLICKNLKENRHYFTGFFSIAIFGAIDFIVLNLKINVNVFSKVFFLIVGGLYAYHLFGQRMRQISKMNVDHIKNSRIIAFYLTQFEELVKLQHIKESKLLRHQRRCNKVSCFCHK